MKILELKRDFTINQWLEIVNIREETRKSYLLGMQTFTEFTNKTPEQLLNEADKEQDENIKVRNRAVNKHLYGFRNYLQEKGLAPLSVKAYINGVKSFYKAFDIEFKPIKQEGAVVLKENKKIPTIEDMRDILKVCDPLEKAIILVGCSSGIDSSTMSNLLVSDFKNGYDPATGITALVLRRTKTNIDFVTFLTPEASEAVLNYMSFRARTVNTTETKRLNQLAKQRVYADSNHLFILRKINDEFLKDYDEAWRKIDRPAFMKIYRDISTKANKNTEKGQFNFIRSHNFRKFFDSTMLNAGCDFLHVEEFMGHKLPGTQNHYYSTDVEGLKNYYKNFIPYLTINKNLSVTDSQEWQEMKDENMRLRSLAFKYFNDGLDLMQENHELRKTKFKAMTDEEKKAEFIRMANKIEPTNEHEMKFVQELKKVLGIVD